MPLVGTICCQTGQPQEFSHCLQCARTGQPASCKHSLPLIKFMANKEKSREGVGLSATGIIACPRQNVLLTDTDYYEKPGNFLAQFRGEIWHEGFEKWLVDEPDIISEVRLEKEVVVELGDRYDRGAATNPVHLTLSGKSDQVYRSRGLITDTKTVGRAVDCDPNRLNERQMQFCERMKLKEPYPEHVAQVNIYAWLWDGGTVVSENPWYAVGEVVHLDIVQGGIIYIGEGGKSERKFPVEIWSREEQERYIHERLRYRARYTAFGQLPPLLPVEKIVKSRNTERRYVKRNFKCDWCPVRRECDQLAVRDTGLDPNEPEYWDAIGIDPGTDLDRPSDQGAGTWTPDVLGEQVSSGVAGD
jgi:hypothetical protein